MICLEGAILLMDFCFTKPSPAISSLIISSSQCINYHPLLLHGGGSVALLGGLVRGDGVIGGSGDRSVALEVLWVVLLTPVLLALLFLRVIVDPSGTVSGGLLGLSLPLGRVAAGGEVLLPLIDEVLDVFGEARLEGVDLGIVGNLIAVEGPGEHAVKLLSGLEVQ